jgi:hypothetical protein
VWLEEHDDESSRRSVPGMRDPTGSGVQIQLKYS